MTLPPMNVYTSKSGEWFEKVRYQWPLTAHVDEMQALLSERKLPVELTMDSMECTMEIDLPEGGSLEYVSVGDHWHCTKANPPSGEDLYAMWEKQHVGQWPVWLNEPAVTTGPSHHRRAAQLKEMVPGLMRSVSQPCSCNTTGMYLSGSVWQVIQHLNDTHHPNNGCADKWSRERIADWLDSLDVDLTVDPSRKSAPVIRRSWYNGAASAEAAKATMATIEVKIEAISQSVLELLIGADKAAEALAKLSKAASKDNKEEA